MRLPPHIERQHVGMPLDGDARTEVHAEQDA
jgi:hypothetical protein